MTTDQPYQTSPGRQSQLIAAVRSSDGLHIAGPEQVAVDVELALDDRGVGHDLAVHIQHEMNAPDGMTPVLVGEPLVFIGPECDDHQRTNRRDLRLRQLRGRKPAQSQPMRFDVGAPLVALAERVNLA